MDYKWKHNRRFNAYSNYFKSVFGDRVQKVAINAGFTCPNRDGSVSVGGCSYCNNSAFNPSYCLPEKSVAQQINEGIEFHRGRYKNVSKYLAYFQAYSNTYAPLDRLKEIYDQAMQVPEIVGIVIGTRPDCIDDEKLSYFKELSKEKYLTIEYGVESVYNKSLKAINRGHTYEKSVEAIEKTSSMGIRTGAHFIFGLPTESREEMLESVDIISKLPLNNIKFHQLQIIKDTNFAKKYIENPKSFNLFKLEEYIEFFIKFLERLNPNFVVERFFGESPPRFFLGKPWGLRNDQLLNLVEKRLEELDTWQGKEYNALMP